MSNQSIRAVSITLFNNRVLITEYLTENHGVRKNTVQRNNELDGSIVWNAHNTVLGSKRLAISATV